jgi:hypothetical protein
MKIINISRRGCLPASEFEFHLRFISATLVFHCSIPALYNLRVSFSLKLQSTVGRTVSSLTMQGTGHNI